jgi:hypothetical protein
MLQQAHALRREQIVELDREHLLHRVGEVGMDRDLLHVGHDEQGRVLQALAVLQQLLVGFGEVGVFALVLPGEKAALPDIGPALAAALLVGAGLEGVARAARVVLHGGGVADQAAQVDKMLLVTATFLDGSLPPLLDECLGSEHRNGGVHIRMRTCC